MKQKDFTNLKTLYYFRNVIVKVSVDEISKVDKKVSKNILEDVNFLSIYSFMKVHHRNSKVDLNFLIKIYVNKNILNEVKIIPKVVVDFDKKVENFYLKKMENFFFDKVNV